MAFGITYYYKSTAFNLNSIHDREGLASTSGLFVFKVCLIHCTFNLLLNSKLIYVMEMIYVQLIFVMNIW